MNLKQLKEHFESMPKGTVFNYGLSDPFSWRGIYAEVAFSILEEPMCRADILTRIDRAYNGTFIGWKGGEYRYSDHTNVNFEAGQRNYTDGEYCEKLILEFECREPCESQEMRLIKLAFRGE